MHQGLQRLQKVFEDGLSANDRTEPAWLDRLIYYKLSGWNQTFCYLQYLYETIIQSTNMFSVRRTLALLVDCGFIGMKLQCQPSILSSYLFRLCEDLSDNKDEQNQVFIAVHLHYSLVRNSTVHKTKCDFRHGD